MAERARPDFKALKPLRMFLPYLMRHRVRVLFSLLALLGAAGATLAIPLLIGQVVDNGFSGADTADVNRYFGGVLFVAVLLAAFSAGRYYLVTSLGERVTADVRKDVFAHIMSLSAPFFDTARSGEIASRLTADTTLIKSAAAVSVSMALRSGLMFLGAVIMMVVTSLGLSGLVLAMIPVVVLPLIIFGRMVRNKTKAAQTALADSMAYASEMIGGARTVQAYSSEDHVTGRYSDGIEESFSEARSSIRARAFLVAFSILVIFTSITVILWYATTDVIAGNLSAGTLSQFVLYAIFAAGALGQLSEVWAEVSHAAGAAERLTELLEEQPSISAPALPQPVSLSPGQAVRFENVSFSYPSARDVPVLNGIDLEVSHGERVAIVGPSGGGKSTLFQLLTRFYDPDDGRISIGGTDLKDADPVELRRLFASVAQDPFIFAAPIAENIRFGCPEAGDDEVQKAAELAHADGFIAGLSDGYRTMVGERGITLSGGQRQRIAIARAILRDAPVLLLDEATSALDGESEAAVQDGLDRLMKDRTTLVIAHRLATVRDVDRILVVENGRIAESGTHSELAGRGGLYSRLAALQLRDEAA